MPLSKLFAPWSVVLTSLIPAAVCAETPVEQCRREMHARVKQLDSRMRQGYTVREGERLKDLHRRLTRIRASCDQDPAGWKKSPRL